MENRFKLNNINQMSSLGLALDTRLMFGPHLQDASGRAFEDGNDTAEHTLFLCPLLMGR